MTLRSINHMYGVSAPSTERAPRQCGVGVYLKLVEECIEVKATEPGCSADDRLFPGDIVIAVGSTSCVGMSVRDTTRLIVGEEGSCVTLTVLRLSAISPTSIRTFMKETPVVLTRQPLPEQRSSRDVRALQAHPAAELHLANSLPDHLSPLVDLDEVSAPLSQVDKADGVLRQFSFLVQNAGPLPIQLLIFDCDDVMRVNETVAPSSQYPFEQHTCALPFYFCCFYDHLSTHEHPQIPAAAVQAESSRCAAKWHERVLFAG